MRPFDVVKSKDSEKRRFMSCTTLLISFIIIFCACSQAQGGNKQSATPHIYSHRGASKEAEEHSFAAYDLAIEYGSKNIEQDVVLSKEGTLYVSHDESAERLTGDRRLYEDMRDSEIDRLRTRSGNHILKLSDVFDRYGERICYIIELKSGDMDTIRAFQRLVDRYGYQDHIVVQCYSAKALQALEHSYPNMPKLYLCEDQSAFERGCELSYVDILSVNKALCNDENCTLAHKNNKAFNVWILNTRDEIRMAIDLGVDTYFTDDTKLALSIENTYGEKKRDG